MGRWWKSFKTLFFSRFCSFSFFFFFVFRFCCFVHQHARQSAFGVIHIETCETVKKNEKKMEKEKRGVHQSILELYLAAFFFFFFFLFCCLYVLFSISTS